MIKDCCNQSILDSIDTGFGSEQTLVRECSDYKLPLVKENFLSEFKTEEDRSLVRRNLGIANTTIDVISLVKKTISEEKILTEETVNKTYVTKKEAENFVTKKEVQDSYVTKKQAQEQFITRKEVESNYITNIQAQDFVKAEKRSSINYNIPNNLF